MTAQTALFIGGTGIISTACVQQAVAAGFEVWLLNRGLTSTRPVPPGAQVLTADVRDPSAVAGVLAGRDFDVVADFLTFTPDQLRSHLDLLPGRAGQYVFISSASAYQTPPERLPITESTPLRNPYLQYSRDKIACEDLLVAAYRDDRFPATIVRPSHTYDHTSVPFGGGWTILDRMRRGVPVVVHGDGTSPWTLTHHTDFARAFTGLLASPQAIGDSFHITSDESLTWDQIARELGAAAGAEPQIVHVPSDVIAAADPGWGASLLGDHAHPLIFDNAKIKRAVPGWSATVPFARGAREIVAWHDGDAARRTVDAHVDALMDRLTDALRPG
ncbi:MAG: NAD-dependent epimerase/dehydratase family protein, partial [Actinomycetota bacterium]